MPPMEQMNALKVRQDARNSLEDKAEITSAMDRAREGIFIALGAMGDEATPEEFFADEYDHFRGRARDAYFSVQNLALRKELIAAQLAVDAHVMRSFDEDIAVALRAAPAANAKALNPPWTKAARYAVSAVAFGEWVFGHTGTLAGAMGGFFLRQGVTTQANTITSSGATQANQKLDTANKEKAQYKLWPECFSREEEFTGEGDSELDHQSAYANVLRAGAV